MAPPDKTLENPAVNPRETVVAETRTLLNRMQEKINDELRAKLLSMLEKQNVEVKKLENVNALLKELQNVYDNNPEQTLRILGEISRISEDGAIATENVTSKAKTKQKTSPRNKTQFDGAVEKITSMMDSVKKQLSGLGYGTFRMLEEFLANYPLFTNILKTLKNSVEAKVAEVAKALEANNLSLEETTSVDAVAGLIMSQITDLSNDKKLPPSYQFDNHVSALMTKINKRDELVSFDDFATAGQQIRDELLPIPATPATTTTPAPVQPTVTPSVAPPTTPERAEKELAIGTTEEVVISKVIPEKITVTRAAESEVKMKVSGKTASFKQLDGKNIVTVKTMATTDTKPTSIIFALSDNSQIEIVATELKNNADGNTTIVRGKKLGGKNESIEINEIKFS